MTLWLVGQLRGSEHARHVQHLREYDPAPPYVFSTLEASSV
jgi:hypothetical protein